MLVLQDAANRTGRGCVESTHIDGATHNPRSPGLATHNTFGSQGMDAASSMTEFTQNSFLFTQFQRRSGTQIDIVLFEHTFIFTNFSNNRIVHFLHFSSQDNRDPVASAFRQRHYPHSSCVFCAFSFFEISQYHTQAHPIFFLRLRGSTNVFKASFNPSCSIVKVSLNQKQNKNIRPLHPRFQKRVF